MRIASRLSLGLLVCLSVFCSPLLAEISIDGELTRPPYSLIRLKAGGESQSFAWSVVNSELLIAEFAVLDSGREVVFTGPPGRYLVTLVGMREGGIDLLQRSVVIGVAPTPNPTPTPVPTPIPQPTPPGPTPPKPDFDKGKFDLARQTYDWCQVLTQHRDVADELADNFERVANGIHGDGAGSRSIPTKEAAQAEIRKLNAAVLGTAKGDKIEAWIAVLKPWGERVRDLDAAGKLDWPGGVEAVYRETAEGLRAVK